MARQSKLKSAQIRRDTALAEYQATIIERKLARVNGKYDAVDTANDKKRRTPKIETENEEKILKPYDRLKAANVGRNIERNMTNAKSIINQLKLNVVGSLGKIQLNIDDKELANKAAFWFNSVWSKDCDGRDDMHFSEMCQLVVAAIHREGDVLVVFDDFNYDDGKLLFWETDQLVSVDEADWAQQTEWVEKVTRYENGKKITTTVPLRQESGVVYSWDGRIVAYIVTGTRGKTSVPLKDATIYPKTVAKLIKKPWRFNQRRGVGDMLPASNDMEDIYEMRASELQSAKAGSKIIGKVKKKDAMEQAAVRSGINPEELTEDDEPAAGEEEKNYEKYETLTGGILEYMDPTDDFELLDFNRPSVNVASFFNFVLASGGASFGLAKAYAILSADSSYTSFRGDMILTWVTFYYLQKWLERRFADWCAIKSLKWAQEKGKINQLPEGWEHKISWQWPVMPHVDEEKEEKATGQAQKNATTDFAKLLGPNWKEKMDSYAEQIEYARQKKLPLSIFETKAGAPADTNSNGENQK
jgi:hypothetical protein